LGRNMQIVVTMRLYEYWHEQAKIRKKRWNNKEIKKFYWMQIVVNMRLYEYWHEQVKIRKKRWNNKEIKKFYWK
jgi:hypothetical protein